MSKIIFDMGARNPRSPQPLEYKPIIWPESKHTDSIHLVIGRIARKLSSRYAGQEISTSRVVQYP